MARPLKKTNITLPNSARIESRPITKSKGRHWVAFLGDDCMGEFKTWQETSYHRQDPDSYGRGGGSYSTSMVRSSWFAPDGESPLRLNTERQFYEWKRLIRSLPHPAVKHIPATSEVAPSEPPCESACA